MKSSSSLSPTDSAVLPVTGYELLNDMYVQDSFALLHQLGYTKSFVLGESFVVGDFQRPEILHAVLNHLLVLGFIKQRGTKEYVFENRSLQYIAHADIFVDMAATYRDILHTLKKDLGFPNVDESATRVNSGADRISALALLPAALAYFHSISVRGLPFLEALQQKEGVSLSHFKEDADTVLYYLDVLERLELVGYYDDVYVAPISSSPLLSKSNYAMLVASYYEMHGALKPLLLGEMEYGFEKDVYRDAELNAKASDAIINVKVAPFIAGAMRGNIENRFRRGMRGDWGQVKAADGHLDLGSGGGNMLLQVDSVSASIGIDINEHTNGVAKEAVDILKRGEDISFICGSMVNSTVLGLAKSRFADLGISSPLATTNFIPHELGCDSTLKFLKNFSEFFGRNLLVVTETLRTSIVDLMAFPNRIATTFQFDHTASGQTLYTEEELQEIISSSLFDILARKNHASAPCADGGRRPTIASFLIRSSSK